MSTGATELLRALSLTALYVGGLAVASAAADRAAALRGVAAGLGTGGWLAALWWIHAGVL